MRTFVGDFGDDVIVFSCNRLYYHEHYNFKKWVVDGKFVVLDLICPREWFVPYNPYSEECRSVVISHKVPVKALKQLNIRDSGRGDVYIWSGLGLKSKLEEKYKKGDWVFCG